MISKNVVIPLRKVALIEGVSFLLLVFIAMPLKYFMDLPLAVKVVGWIHGVLFMLLCALLLRAWVGARWPLGRAVLVFIASLLPFGPFLIDRRMRTYEVEFANRSINPIRPAPVAK